MSEHCFIRSGVRSHILLSAFLFSPVITSHAREPEVLPQIVVTASRNEQAHADALPHTTLLTAEDIRNAGVTDLPSLLQREAGLQLTQSGGPGQPVSLFMRGSTPAQVLVLLDGVPLRREGFSAATALEHLLPSQIDRIEIVRGNVSAIYGSSAVGGVIQIFTRKSEGATSTRFFVETGSQATRTVTGAVSGSTGSTRYALSLTQLDSDGVSASRIAQYPNENPDRDGFRNRSLSGLLAREWQPGQEIGLRLYANDASFRADGGGYGTATDTGRGASQQQSWAVYSKNRLSGAWEATLTMSESFNRIDNRYDSNDPSVYVYDTRGDTRNQLLQWQHQLRLSPAWILNAGVEAGRDRLIASDFLYSTRDEFQRNRSSAYAGLNAALAQHQLQLNVRRDDIGAAGADTTGYAGYGFALTEQLKVIASTSTAFNAPTLAQQYDPYYGNASLRAERSRSHELGVQHQLPRGLVRLTAFSTRTQDQFGYDPVTYQTTNIDRARNEGVEISAYGQFANTDVRFSLTAQDPVNAATGASLVRRAKWLAAVSATRKFGAWQAGGDISYTGSRADRDAVASRDVRLAPYWLVNLTARYAIDREWSLHLRLLNVLDADYQTSYGFNSLPRSLFVGIGWQR